MVFVPVDALGPPPAPAREAPPVPLLADRLRVTLEPGLESRLTLVWTLRPLAPGVVDLPLVSTQALVEEATLDGRPLPLAPAEDGWLHAAVALSRPATLRLRLSVASPAAAFWLRVAPAARRELAVLGPWEVEATDAVRVGDRLLGGEPSQLTLSWRPAGPPAPRPRVTEARSWSALRLDSAGLEVVARARWTVSHGELSELALRLPAEAEALEVEGEGVLETRREGDRVIVSLARPVSDKIDIDVRYRAPALGETARALPLAWPEADHASGWASLLRADEALVVPSAGAGAEPIPTGQLPAEARGLAEGAVIASYRLEGAAPALNARALVWEPIDGPPTVIDEARYEIASADHGRYLLRARFQVRNDRRQYLRLRVPDELALVSVTVAGRTVPAARDPDGRLLIPLEKSVETLDGLVSFPVDLSFYGLGAPWERRGSRAVRTPAVDAPIAYARWELVLPPGYESRGVEGAITQVEGWSSREHGLQYGRAYGAPLGEDAPPEAREELAQSLWNEAYAAYKAGDYLQSGELLRRTLDLDQDNAAAAALNRNVELLLDTSGATRGGEEEAATRRVRELAGAKTAEATDDAERLRQQALEAERAGDLDKAEKTLSELVVVSSTLAGVEQAEQVDRKNAYKEDQASLERVRARKDVRYQQRTEIAFEAGAPSAPTSARASRAPAEPLTEAYATAAREKRHESMEFLKQLVAERNPQGEQRAEMMLRLADLYDAEAEDLRREEATTLAATLERCALAPGCDVDAELLRRHAQASQSYSDKAGKLYRRVLESYPQYARADEARAGLRRVEERQAAFALRVEELAADEPPEALEVPPGQAAIIAEDPEALRQALEALVLDPDLADLLTGEDLSWEGDEDLRIEVVYEQTIGGRMGAAGVAEGLGGLGTRGQGASVSAVPAPVPIPRAGQSLLFEARLVPEDQPLALTLRFRRARP